MSNGSTSLERALMRLSDSMGKSAEAIRANRALLRMFSTIGETGMQSKDDSMKPGRVNVHGGYSLEQGLASVGAGWHDLVKGFFQACEDAGVEVSQVKEKFGALRIYTNRAPDYIWDLANKLEVQSSKICEECGKRGKQRTGGWIRTLCEEHAEGRPATNLFK